MLEDVPTHPRSRLLLGAHVLVLLFTLSVGCAHRGPPPADATSSGSDALVLIDAAPDDSAFAIDVARALRRRPSPRGGRWVAATRAPSVPLAEALAAVEARFYDLDLVGAEQLAREMLDGIDDGRVVVGERDALLRALLLAAQIFEARGALDDADAALLRAEAVRPGYELSAAAYPPSLLERRAALTPPTGTATLELVGLSGAATVRVDGAVAPGGALRLPPGRHVVRVTEPGHVPWQRAVDLGADTSPRRIEPEREVDTERLHELSPEDAQRYVAARGGLVVRLRVGPPADTRSLELLVPGEAPVRVSAPLDEAPDAAAARLVAGREAQLREAADAEVRRRRRIGVVTGSVVVAAGAGTGLYLGLRPGAEGWRGSGNLGGNP